MQYCTAKCAGACSGVIAINPVAAEGTYTLDSSLNAQNEMALKSPKEEVERRATTTRTSFVTPDYERVEIRHTATDWRAPTKHNEGNVLLLNTGPRSEHVGALSMPTSLLFRDFSEYELAVI